MEGTFFDAATADLLVKVGWHLASAFLALVVGVISTLLWGRGGRKRLVERLAALEAQKREPSITQTFNFHGPSTADEREHHLRNAMDTATVRGLKETIRSLPQIPLGDNHTYARLPDGTNIVSMADGTYRLAIPKPLQASSSFGPMSASATLRNRKSDNDQ